MKPNPYRSRRLVAGLVTILAGCLGSVANAGDALPSWNDGPSKTAIQEFVAAVTDEKGKGYVAPPERIAELVRELHAAGAPARGHIMNLGHGCLPDTPVEGVRAFTAAARALGGSA